MKYPSKIDANQPDIVKSLRAGGCSVVSLSAVGSGCPDLLVGYRGRNIVLEVKDPTQPASARVLKPKQLTFHQSWVGQVDVVTDSKEAWRVVMAVTDGI